MKNPDLAEPESNRAWTRVDDYSAPSLRWRIRSRRASKLKPRSEAEDPGFFLSTLPFLLLIAGLALIGIAIALVAFPGAQPERKPPPPVHRELGTAPRGWFQEAQKQFHH